MGLNDIIFQKTNGGMGRPAANEDIISGLIMSLSGDVCCTKFEPKADGTKTFDIIEKNGSKLYVAKLNFYEQLAAQYGIEVVEKPEADEIVKVEADENEKAQKALKTKKRQALNAIDYHVREFFRMSPAGVLYLAIRLCDEVNSDDIKNLQYYSGGLLRQVGILTETISEKIIENYQQACTGIEGQAENKGLFAEHQPLSVIMTYLGKKTEDGSVELAVPTVLNDSTNEDNTGSGEEDDETTPETPSKKTLSDYADIVDKCPNVSVLIGCDRNTELEGLIGEFYNYGCIGTALGAISKAAVHECIAWVQKFPLGLKEPGFITGELLKNVAQYELELINEKRYIFVRTHVGSADNYFNDSHTLDEATSDYAYIENVRTIDKATRGIRTNLLPYLNAPLYVDASTGKLRADMVAFLETTAGRALEDMEQAGELSGYKVVIDPNQNVLASSMLEINIKKVPVGVMRKVLIKIGYTTSLA